MANDLAAAIRASAQRLGVDPIDLGTTISYETGGTFDPWKKGPTTKYGEHRGLIQWGEPQRERYGVRQGQPVAQQMHAVERYLTDAGVKPGSGLLDLYSAINAGHVGRPNVSDAAFGGAPGTVADKVAGMSAHRAKAKSLLMDTSLPVHPHLAAGLGLPTSFTPRPAPPAPTPAQPGPTVQAAAALPPVPTQARAEALGMAPMNPAAQQLAAGFTQPANFAAPETSALGGLAAAIMQQHQQSLQAQQQQQDEAAAEQQRRIALFGGRGLYG